MKNLNTLKHERELKVYLSEVDDLLVYARFIMSKGLLHMQTPVSSLRMFGEASCVVLDRRDNFQAELCIFPPGKDIPHHEHPNVDSIEIQITGSLRLFINGVDLMRKKGLEEAKEIWHKVGIRIKAEDDHNVEVGPDGAVFLSVQRWNDGLEPDHIGHNWKGAVFDEVQEEYKSD